MLGKTISYAHPGKIKLGKFLGRFSQGSPPEPKLAFGARLASAIYLEGKSSFTPRSMYLRVNRPGVLNILLC